MFGQTKLRQKIYNKIWMDDHGETITETLVSVLVAAMAMIIFASMITASQRIITKSEKIMDAYYSGISAMEESAAAGTDAGSSGTVSIMQKDGAINYGICTAGSGTGISVQYATNSSDTVDMSNFAVAEYWIGN